MTKFERTWYEKPASLIEEDTKLRTILATWFKKKQPMISRMTLSAKTMLAEECGYRYNSMRLGTAAPTLPKLISITWANSVGTMDETPLITDDVKTVAKVTAPLSRTHRASSPSIDGNAIPISGVSLFSRQLIRMKSFKLVKHTLFQHITRFNERQYVKFHGGMVLSVSRKIDYVKATLFDNGVAIITSALTTMVDSKGQPKNNENIKVEIAIPTGPGSYMIRNIPLNSLTETSTIDELCSDIDELVQNFGKSIKESKHLDIHSDVNYFYKDEVIMEVA